MFRNEGLGFGTELGINTVYYHIQKGNVDTWVRQGAKMAAEEYKDFVTERLQKGYCLLLKL